MFAKRLKKLFIGLLLIVHAASAQTPAPPGKLVDAGGHLLHLQVMGRGSPTVILENGSGDFSFVWSLVQPEIAKTTRVVSYDRAGYAWSEPGPTPRTDRQITFELHTALQHAGIQPPYILVGQSYGGFLVRAFARYYPREVVGMVLVEAVQEDQRIFMGGDEPKRIRDLAKGRKAPPLRAMTGAIKKRPVDSLKPDTAIDPVFRRLPDSVQKLQVWTQSQPGYIKAVQAEMDWSPEDVQNLYQNKGKAGYTLGAIPLIVLTRGSGGYSGRPDSLELEHERLAHQEELAKLSTNSRHIIDPISGHNIHVEDPELVISSIKEVLAAVREKRPLGK